MGVMTAAIRPLIAGNWKMNGLRRDGVARVAALGALAGAANLACDIVVCPPATLLDTFADELSGGPVALGGQDCHADASGAYTGDVSAEMLADTGCRFVIVGHSERRAGHGESDALVRAKAEAANRAGLIAMICVGESKGERDSGDTLAVIERQLAGSLPERADATVIAYEPVWAIGSGRTPTLEQIAEVHGRLRRLVEARGAGEGVRLLYGGSVKPANARDILSLADVDGALVGGASLSVDDFWAICRSCPQYPLSRFHDT